MIKPRRSPRYRVTQDELGRVTLTLSARYSSIGEPESRIYWVPGDGGYVYDITDRPGTSGQQVLEPGRNDGATMWSAPARLPQDIRRMARLDCDTTDREMGW